MGITYILFSLAIKPKHPLHLEIQRRNSPSPVGILRTTFRDPATGLLAHTQHGRLTGVSLDTLLLMQAALRGEATLKSSPEALRISRSREFGASAALLALAKDIGLDKALYSRPSEPWVRDCLAMIIGRIVHQGSKLALSQTTEFSALWELCGVAGPVDVDEHCYASMDRLLERQEAIQKNLAAKYLRNGTLVLYDITSSYFEGEYAESELVQFGYNRDGKRGHEQIVIGLITNGDGCPVSIEVFPGNTQDASTVAAKVAELRENYGVKDIVLVGDRGMITASNEAKLKALPESERLKIISALTHREIVEMLVRCERTPELFDDKKIIEITDPTDPERRYCLCRNPYNAQRETLTRSELIARTTAELTQIATTAARSQKTKKPAPDALIGVRVGKALAKTKMGKFFTWKIHPGGQLHWQLDAEKVAAETALDGCYVIKTTVSAEAMGADEIVARYKSLSQVEQAFRNMKTVSLQMRPMYHKTDARIRAHVFLCMLAYHLQWHMMERQLQNKIIEPKERRWTLTNVLEILKAQRRETVSFGGTTFEQTTEPTADQTQLLTLLRTPPKPKP